MLRILRCLMQRNNRLLKNLTNATLIDYLYPLDSRGARFHFAKFHINFPTRSFAAHFTAVLIIIRLSIINSSSFTKVNVVALRENAPRHLSRSRSRDRYRSRIHDLMSSDDVDVATCFGRLPPASPPSPRGGGDAFSVTTSQSRVPGFSLRSILRK